MNLYRRLINTFIATTATLCVVAVEPATKPVKTVPIEDPELFADNIFTFPKATAAGMELLFETVEEPDMATDLIDLAKSFIGTRYRRGGKTPSGFDCSGFTGYIFNQFGYKLGASSSAQYNQGEPIEKENIAAGDLLFFNGRSVGSRVGHVGIAISRDEETGDITFIHSAIGGGIRIDKVSSPYYKRRFLGARRLLQE